MEMCLNKKVIAGLGVVGLGVLVLAPGTAGAALPLLLIAACPLSMIFMMRSMSAKDTTAGSTRGDTDPDSTTMDEVATLRAEVQHLRAEQAARETPSGQNDR